MPVKATAVALAGSDLVVLVQGAFRDYDAADGSLRHVWTLPNVSSGGDCTYRISFQCQPARTNSSFARLRLQDAARGLVAYVLDDQLHVLRLADGADTTIGPGSHARFMAAGLVYSDGPRIHLVPFDRLPG